MTYRVSGQGSSTRRVMLGDWLAEYNDLSSTPRIAMRYATYHCETVPIEHTLCLVWGWHCTYEYGVHAQQSRLEWAETGWDLFPRVFTIARGSSAGQGGIDHRNMPIPNG